VSAASDAVGSIELDLPGARVAFTTRRGGVSEGPFRSLNLGILTDDDPARVNENRGRAVRASGLAPDQVAMVRQVHGTDVLEWTGPPERGVDPGRALPEADGHTTTTRGLGLLVLAADCLPVALAAPGRVAMVHGGWRGLAGGILERAVAAFDTPPVAAVGPGIGPCCYEVGDEVRAAFADLDGVASGRMLDLKAVVRRRLEAAGVTEVHDVRLCTSCREDLFFSHRRDRGTTGRQGGLAWRTG